MDKGSSSSVPVPPPSVRGRARGRVRATPDQLQQAAGRSAPSVGTPSELSEADTDMSISTKSTCGTKISDISSEIPATPSQENASRNRISDTSSVTTIGDHSRGLRATIKPGFVKQSRGGEEFDVVTNYFVMNKTPDFKLHQYRVDFNPEEDNTEIKKLLVRSQEKVLGAYIFDGHMMYTTKPISNDKWELQAYNKTGNTTFTIYIRFVGYVLNTSPTFLQFYNMVMRKCLTLIGMEELGRHFYDRTASIKFEADRLELWPGVITAIRNHEIETMLCVEVTHKVLRMTNVGKLINQFKEQTRGEKAFEERVKKELIGSIVMTHYNRRTYKIDDVDFNVNPSCTFRQQDGTLIPYADYYLKRYNIKVTDMDQPMLVSIPKKKDVNKGITGNIYLIPSLCHPTGLTDEMRKNFGLMKRLSEHLHMNPNQRKKKLDEFINKIKTSAEVQKEFANWDIDFNSKFVMATARKYLHEKIFMGPQDSPPTIGDRNMDWSRELKGRGMLIPKELNKWIIFAPEREYDSIDFLVGQMTRAAAAINVNVAPPIAKIRYDSRSAVSTMRGAMNTHGENVKFAYIILANNNVHVYGQVKKFFTLEFGIASQCFLAKNLNTDKAKSKLESICTKLIIQLTSKMQGVPWGVKIPAKNMMVLGFDVYHCSERKGQSAGALVSTTDQTLNGYYSSVNFHADKSELAQNLTGGVRQSLEAYRIQNNGCLPDRVILFRDGVGEGQINYVLDVEIPQITGAIKETYAKSEQKGARLAVAIVTKKINSRVLLARRGNPTTFDNVPPGTVVDSTITLPERYDFFLVSQSVNQGTVSPTNYNVVHDESGFTPEQMQRLSYKLCHLYYNWCGTVAVPAPCQYAHKLAYLTGIALNAEAPIELCNSLWYL